LKPKSGGESCFAPRLNVHVEESEMHLLDQRILGIAILLLLGMLVPLEEDGLRKAYGETYVSYQQRTRKLISLVY